MNNQIKPIKSSSNRVTPAPSGSELKSGDTAGNMIQLRIPIGTAARAQMPRILPREYCSPILNAAFARAVVSIFSSWIHLIPGLWDQILRVKINAPRPRMARDRY